MPRLPPEATPPRQSNARPAMVKMEVTAWKSPSANVLARNPGSVSGEKRSTLLTM